jgi:hypothetical protein
VAVEVDEPGRDHEPADVDTGCAVEVFADRADRATVDPHVAHAVEPGLRVDDSTTGQHQVVRHEPSLRPWPDRRVDAALVGAVAYGAAR